MKAPTATAPALNLENPLSPDEFGRWIFHAQKPLQRLATLQEVKPWQLAFFAGWESFLRQSARQAEEIAPPHRHAPSRPRSLTAGKAAPVAFDPGAPIRLASAAPALDPARRHQRLAYGLVALLGLVLLVVALTFASH